MPKRRRPPFFFLLAILASVALFFISSLLAPKPDLENARPKALGDFQFPTATEGRGLPVVWGSSEIKGANTVWYGALRAQAIREKIKTGLFSSERITVGFQYFVGFDMALCGGPISFISKIEIGDKVIFDDVNFSAGGDPDGISIDINRPGIWGGFKKGGGIVGSFQLYDGVADQNPDAYMLGEVNQDVPWGIGDPPGTNKALPGYNNLCHVVWKGGNIGESTSVRNWTITAHRYPNPLGLTGGAERINEDAEGRADANPMNVAYEIMTDTDYGLGINPALIEISEFIAAGDTLASVDEQNGFSMTLDSQKKARDILQEIERQTDGVLFQTTDGRFHFKLTRFDYDPNTLEIFDESRVSEVDSFTRAAWVETQNSLHLAYNDRTDGFKSTATIAQDMANVQIQGREVKAQVNFPGIKFPATAANVAARELKQYAFPLARVTLKCNRDAADLLPGDVFKWSWARYGITEMVLRVADVSLGSLTNGTVQVTAYQDVFALGTTVFTGGGPSLSEPVDATAVPIVTERIDGVPYWFLQDDDSIDEVQLNLGTGERTLHLAEAPNGVAAAFDVVGDLDPSAGVDFQVVARSNTMTPTAELEAEYDSDNGFTGGASGVDTITGFTLKNVTWVTQPDDVADTSIETFGFGLIYINGEILAYENIIDNGDDTYDVTRIHRALLDTVNVTHPIDSKVWFLLLGGATTGVDLPQANSPFTFRNITQTIGDVLDIGDASDIVYALDNRQRRPLRPGRLRINSQALNPDIGSADLITTWLERSILQPRVLDDGTTAPVPAPTSGYPDTTVIELQKRDYLGVIGAVFETRTPTSASETDTYTRAAYLVDSGGVVAGESFVETVYSQYTTGSVDSHQSWVREYLVEEGGLTSVSTSSILLNAGTPATDQQRVEGPALTTVWGSDPTAVSFCGWVKFNDTATALDMLIGGTSDYTNLDDGFGVYLESATELRVFFGDADGPSGGAIAVVDGTDLLDGSWHHFAATWDTVTNQTPRVWVDAVELTPTSSDDRSTAIDRGTAQFDLGRIGTTNAPAASYADANYDEVALYDGVLTDLDVRRIYGGGAPADLDTFGPTADLLLWWRCGEGTGDNANDGGLVNDEGVNANNHDGTPTSANATNMSFPADVP